MQDFVRLERSLFRRIRHQNSRDLGAQAFEEFGHDHDAKTVFVAVDFEGFES